MRLALKLGHDELNLILLSHLQQTLGGRITRVDDVTIVRRRGGQFEVDVEVTVLDDADPSTWGANSVEEAIKVSRRLGDGDLDYTNGESDE